jgi:hypothetical protein
MIKYINVDRTYKPGNNTPKTNPKYSIRLPSSGLNGMSCFLHDLYILYVEIMPITTSIPKSVNILFLFNYYSSLNSKHITMLSGKYSI